MFNFVLLLDGPNEFFSFFFLGVFGWIRDVHTNNGSGLHVILCEPVTVIIILWLELGGKVGSNVV